MLRHVKGGLIFILSLTGSRVSRLFPSNPRLKGPALSSRITIGRGLSCVVERNPLCLKCAVGARLMWLLARAAGAERGRERGSWGARTCVASACGMRGCFPDRKRSEGWTHGPSPRLCLTRLMSAFHPSGYNRKVDFENVLHNPTVYGYVPHTYK